MLGWVFRNPDSKKSNKNGELEADLFRAFPNGSSPEKDKSKFVLGIRKTNRNNKPGYIRDIADIANKPNSFMQLDEMARSVESAVDGSSSRWAVNERASSPRFYRSASRGADAGRNWDSSITGAMAAGPSMSPQDESNWKQREWKRQQLKSYALYPDRDTKLPSLSSALVGDDIARAVSGLDILSDQQVDDLYDKTVEELVASGGRVQGYRAANAPLSPRELAQAANIKRPLIKEFLDEYKTINQDGNISRLDPDNMSDKEVDNFFNTFILPGLINSSNPSVSDIRAAVREPLTQDSLSLAESVAFGIADEYQDLEFRTMLARRMLQDNGLSTNDPNFDKMLEEMVSKEYDKDISNGLATIEDFLDNIPHWFARNPQELLNQETGLPYLPEEYLGELMGDASNKFLEITDRFLDGEMIDPLEALEVQENLDRLLDIAQANGWVSENIRRPEYPEYSNKDRNKEEEEEQEQEEQPFDLEKYWTDLTNYGHQYGPGKDELGPVYEDEFGPLDSEEAWQWFDANGNEIPYDGDPNHPLNLNDDGTPVDVTKNMLLPAQYYRHWLANGHFLREWTEENYPHSQVARYKNLDEMSDVAVPPMEIEDSMYSGAITSTNPLDIDPNVSAGLDRLMEVIAADSPQWFTDDGNGQLIGDLNVITQSGNYQSGGMISQTLASDDYSATQMRTRLKEVRDAAVKQERANLLDSGAAGKQARENLWNKFSTGTLTVDEIAFEERLFDTQNVIAALKKHAVENNISDSAYNDARRVSDAAYISRADEFTKKRIQRIKDEFNAQGIEPKDWAKAIDAEIARQQSIKEKIEIEYSRFRSAFSRQMQLARAIFETRPPNREQQVLQDGTVIPGWDRAKEPAWRYLNRIQRWDNLHFGTREQPGPLTELLQQMNRSSFEDGRDGAAGATARITRLADRNIEELRELRREYTRVKGQADQSGISGFMRLGGRSDELLSSAKLSTRKAAREAAYGNFRFVSPNVLRKYDRAGLPISRNVRNSASGFNRSMTEMISDASRGDISNVRNHRNFKYLSPKMQKLATLISDFADRTRGVRISPEKTSKRNAQRGAKTADIATQEMVDKYNFAKARAYTSRLVSYNPPKLSPDAEPVFFNTINGAMRLNAQQVTVPGSAEKRWAITDDFGRALSSSTYASKDEAEKLFNALPYSRYAQKPLYSPTDSISRSSVLLGQNVKSYLSTDSIGIDSRYAQSDWVYGQDKLPKKEAGDAVILRTNPETGKRQILLIERVNGPHTSATRALSLPGGFRDKGESLRETAQREALEEVNVTDKDIIQLEHLGEIDAPDWDPRFVKGINVAGVLLEVSPDTDVIAKDDAATAEWFDLDYIATGERPLAFGHAAFVLAALAGTDDEVLYKKFENLNALSRRRQQAIIQEVNAGRKGRIGLGKVKLFPKNLGNPDNGWEPSGPDAEIRAKKIAAMVVERFGNKDNTSSDGGIAGAMGARYVKGRITNWATDTLSKRERDKILRDVISERKKTVSPTDIYKKLNVKWQSEDFKRVDGSIHKLNVQQVKDVIYKARLDGVKFSTKLRGEIAYRPVQNPENVKLIVQRSVNGFSVADIAHELDISSYEVTQVQRALGLSGIGKKPKVDRDKKRILELIGNGQSFQDAAKQLGITEKSARKRYNEAISAGDISGAMGNPNSLDFSAFTKILSDGRKRRQINADVFYFKTYERLSNNEIAKSTGIDASEVDDAVQNHSKFIADSKDELTSLYERAFKNNGKRFLTASEARHMKMRFDGMSINRIAEIEGYDETDLLLSEQQILKKLQNSNSDLFPDNTQFNENPLFKAKINSNSGIGKRLYIAEKYDGLDVSTLAKIEDITPFQAKQYIDEYSKELEKTNTPALMKIRRDVAFNNSNLNESQQQFINMRLDGVSIADMATMNNRDSVDVKIEQLEITNRMNFGSITGAMSFPRREYKDNDYYGILGVPDTANEKELREAYRKAARATHPDLHPGDKKNEELFKKISEAYAVLSNPVERDYYDSVKRLNPSPTSRNNSRQETSRARKRPQRNNPTADSSEPLGEDLSYNDPVTGRRIPDWYVRQQRGLPFRWADTRHRPWEGGSENIADDIDGDPINPNDLWDEGPPIWEDGVSGQMKVGPSATTLLKREQRESRVEKASKSLDRMMSENPAKYKNLKKSAVAVHNAATSQNVKEQNIIDVPEDALTKFKPAGRAADNLQREFTVSKNIKQHLLIRRMMAELMSDFSVDKDGNLKEAPESYVSDEKNIARRDFNNGLSDAAKEVISKNGLLTKRRRAAGQAGQLAANADEEKRITETIEKMLGNGKTPTQIADYLQISRQALSNRLKRMGLTKRRTSQEEILARNKTLAEFYAKNPNMTRREISEATGISLENVKEGLKEIGASRKTGPKKKAGTREKKGRSATSGVTGAMSLFGRGNKDKPTGKNNTPDFSAFNPKPFVPVQMPTMSDVLAKRINFRGKLTTYPSSNYTSSAPSSTLSSFIAKADEPFVGVDATFGGTTKIKEDRFWDLYQPVAVALSKSVTKKRAAGEVKKFISVGGPPGSGKSTARLGGKNNIPGTDSAVHIDADEIKTIIPEAVEMHAAGNPNWGNASHEESRIIADIAIKVALENENDIVYDSTGQYNSGFGTLKAARAKGYEIVLHYNVAPENVLYERIDEREKTDPRRLPRHIIPAVNQRNSSIFPDVAKSADEFYLWETNVSPGQEPRLLARKQKGGKLEILDEVAYAYGKFDADGQAVTMSRPSFKMDAKKVSKNSVAGKILQDFESGMTVEEIAAKNKMQMRTVFDYVTRNEIDPTLPDIQVPTRPSLFPGPTKRAAKPIDSGSLSDSEAINLYRNLSQSDKAALRDFILKKPGATLDALDERVPLDLVIWASNQKLEHIQPVSQTRAIEKLESLPEGKRDRLTEMLQAGETVVDIANELNISFSIIDVAMDFVDQYGYIPEAGDTDEKSAYFGSVSMNRRSRIIGKTIKASLLNGAVINER
jgi:curved DNA-binding protein CbpA/ADP-ribose pyrophosphatase YjhB (NUDIX family)/predicted ABC-type ATPase/DNA-binding CsgD family transcriptional regulator